MDPVNTKDQNDQVGRLNTSTLKLKKKRNGHLNKSLTSKLLSASSVTSASTTSEIVETGKKRQLVRPLKGMGRGRADRTDLPDHCIDLNRGGGVDGIGSGMSSRSNSGNDLSSMSNLSGLSNLSGNRLLVQPVNNGNQNQDWLSYSMMVDTRRVRPNPTVEPGIRKSVGKIHSRRRATWANDESVSTCAGCDKPFNFYIRKHHCRCCGSIFCYKCTEHRMAIPKHLEHLPEPHLEWIPRLPTWSEQKVRLCDPCAQRVVQLKNLDRWIKVFNMINLSIDDYKRLCGVSKFMNHLGNYYLSRFREIQYKLPHQILTPLEKKLLWNSRPYLSGHSQWLLALARSIDYTDYQSRSTHLQELIELLRRPEKRRTCWHLMCTRICRPQIGSLEAILLLDSKINSHQLRSYAIQVLRQRASTLELNCYIPYLTHQMSYESLDRPLIGNFLIELAQQDRELANEIYWELKINMENQSHYQIYQFFLQKFINTIDDQTQKEIEDSDRLVNFLHSLPPDATEEEIRDLFRKNQNLFQGVKLPTHPDLICQEILVDGIKIKRSASRPIFLPLKCYHPQRKKMVEYFLLYKFEDIRPDQIIMKLIQLMDLLLKHELGMDLHILTYNIKPTTSRSGLIEIVPNCQTIYQIKEKLQFSILNYMIENNPTVPAETLRQRFLRSCAAYCVITYLLGVGDRHLENIMITNTGYLFHIDYGFIIGSDPKPMTHPKMRITTDMVDALGGPQSKYYLEFVQLAQTIHNCLRRHINLIMSLLSLLVQVRPPIERGYSHARAPLTLDRLTGELVRRFMHGESYEQARLQLCTQIDSCSQSYQHAVIDWFHYHQKENTVQSVVSNTLNGTVNMFSNLYTNLMGTTGGIAGPSSSTKKPGERKRSAVATREAADLV